MNINKTVNIQMEPEDMDRLVEGQPLQIPIDQKQGIVLYPPDAREESDE